MKTYRLCCYLLNAVLISVTVLHAGSARKMVARGNQAYNEKRFDEAMSAYESAEKQCPDSEHILFNKGVVYYQQGDYTNAISLFERAALMSDDTTLTAKSIYNKGNSYFRQAEELKSLDPKASLEKCESSIRSYQEALELDPEMKDTAKNLEIARLLKKTISEEMLHRQMQNPQHHASTNFNEQLQNTAQKQQQLLNKTIQEANSSETEKQAEQGAQLSSEQKQLREELEKLMQENPEQVDNEQLQRAVEHQKEAEKQLENQDWKSAIANEQKALDEIKNIQDKLSNQLASKEQKQEQGEKKANEFMNQSQKQQLQKDTTSENNQAISPELSELRNILEEERQYRKIQEKISAGYKPVDKDW